MTMATNLFILISFAFTQMDFTERRVWRLEEGFAAFLAHTKLSDVWKGEVPEQDRRLWMQSLCDKCIYGPRSYDHMQNVCKRKVRWWIESTKVQRLPWRTVRDILAFCFFRYPFAVHAFLLFSTRSFRITSYHIILTFPPQSTSLLLLCVTGTRIKKEWSLVWLVV